MAGTDESLARLGDTLSFAVAEARREERQRIMAEFQRQEFQQEMKYGSGRAPLISYWHVLHTIREMEKTDD